MRDFLILKLVDVFKGVYKACGVDYKKMRLILQSKLLMDSRRTNNTNTNSEESKEKNYFYGSLIVYAIIGIFSAVIIMMNIDPMIKMSMYFGFFMIMILTVFISDFSSVILDVNDKDILSTKGVDPKTLNAAKFTHIFIYISMLSLAISGASLLASLRFGIGFFALFLVNIFLVDILMIIVTAIMYFIILKLFSGEKLKDILNTFQIIFLLIFTVGYQVVVQAFQLIDLQLVYTPSVFNIFLPPMWFAANFSLLQYGELNKIIITLKVLSIVIPVVCLVLYIKSIPRFEKNLQKLNDNTYTKVKKKDTLSFKCSKIICKNKEERVFFNFVNNVLSKDREFKTKIYPSLAMAAFMPILMIVVSYDKSGIRNYINSIDNSFMMLVPYLGVIISQNMITMIKYSNEFEASWIYEILPIKEKKNIYSGMLKATMYRLVLPIFLIVGIMFTLIFNIKMIVHLVVMFLVAILCSMFTFKINEKNLPFSVEYIIAGTSSNIIVVLKSMFVVGMLGIIHFFVMKSLLLTLIYLIALSIIIYVFWNKTFTV
ncbi:hypothetical protein CHL78_015330 [Romboutsia weinsteinii]|uniref:Uncharacterized protein n=1 Tax=Romboutsia weinsteinii TaxID=2020949 RepID=A0A371IZK6_9FIRM|nr:hypothetical protein [Romboutsia weinsteinii]RDY26002.1 hypothetical protein CHL78_015330 [Romboutsia weinsteinii]